MHKFLTITQYDNLLSVIESNPYTILVFDHLDLMDSPKNLSIKSFCIQQNIDQKLFLALLNIYMGNYKFIDLPDTSSLLLLIHFLRRSHQFYQNEKYPQIENLLNQLQINIPIQEMLLLKQFFDAYFNEVKEHLEYEERIVFPYIESLFFDKLPTNISFSIDQYKEQHNDIEEKLGDLKNLLLHHLKTGKWSYLKRQIILHLYELEFDLHAHSIIEDTILIPLIKQKETQYK